MKKSLIWGIVIVAIIIVAGFMYNSTMTGQAISKHRIINDGGDTGEIKFNGITYTISEVEVSRTGMVSLTITNNNIVESSYRIENAEEITKQPVSTAVGPIEVWIAKTIYNQDVGKSSVEVVLYPK